MSAHVLCDSCNERPEGCWKARDYGCNQEYNVAKSHAISCPLKLWDTVTLHIPSIKTVVYTTNKPHCVSRHPRVVEILNSRGFKNWEFFWGKAGEPYWEMIRPEYTALLRENDPPFCILEDDIAVKDWQPVIYVPAQAEVVYLGGGGSWGRSHLVREAREHLPELKIYRVRDIGWSEINNEWVRTFGMFGTHAIVYLNKRVMLEMADAIEQGSLQVDVIFGMNQWRWQCLLRRTPMFFQDDGHNNWGTMDYGPLEHHPESHTERVRRLRKTRRQLVAR